MKWWWFGLSRPNPGRRENIGLNFYFHTFLWCLSGGWGGGGGGAGPFKAVRELMGCVQNFQDLSCWEALVTLHL